MLGCVRVCGKKKSMASLPHSPQDIGREIECDSSSYTFLVCQQHKPLNRQKGLGGFLGVMEEWFRKVAEGVWLRLRGDNLFEQHKLGAGSKNLRCLVQLVEDLRKDRHISLIPRMELPTTPIPNNS